MKPRRATHVIRLPPWVFSCLALWCENPNQPTLKPKRLAIAAIEVSPDSMRLRIGELSPASCYPRNNFGTLLADSCNWRSIDTLIAQTTTGSQTANITAKTVGRTGVYAGTDDKRDTLWITVVDATSPPRAPSGNLPTPLRIVNVEPTDQLKAAIQSASP